MNDYILIENYLKELFKEHDLKELLELREELNDHLITLTTDFLNEGYDVNDAQEKAINEFDDIGIKSQIFLISRSKININKQNLSRLYSIRYSCLSAFGLSFGTAIYTLDRGSNDYLPLWILCCLGFSTLLVIIVSILIYLSKKKVNI